MSTSIRAKNPPTHRADFQIFDRQKGGRNVYLLNTQRKCLRKNSNPYFMLDAKMVFLDSKRPSNRPYYVLTSVQRGRKISG